MVALSSTVDYTVALPAAYEVPTWADYQVSTSGTTSLASTSLTIPTHAIYSAISSPLLSTPIVTRATTSKGDPIPTTTWPVLSSLTSTASATPGPILATGASTGLSLGARIGIGMAATITLLLLINISFFLLRRGRKHPRVEQEELGPETRKAELEDQARHELSGGSLTHWLNRWRNGVRRTSSGREPQELSGESRVELPHDVLPQELRTGPRSSACGSDKESESSSADWLPFPERIGCDLEETMVILNNAGSGVEAGSSRSSSSTRGRAGRQLAHMNRQIFWRTRS